MRLDDVIIMSKALHTIKKLWKMLYKSTGKEHRITHETLLAHLLDLSDSV